MKLFSRKNAPLSKVGNDNATSVELLVSAKVQTKMTELMNRMEKRIEEQQIMMDQQNKQLNTIMETFEDEKIAEPLPIDCGSYAKFSANTKWLVTGVTSREPDPDHIYFPGLMWSSTSIEEPSTDKVISAIIPCYNEEGKDLERTIRGLRRQVLPDGWRMEAVIVMDGVVAMSESMSAFLSQIFGVHFGRPSEDPFQYFPDANTIIVQPADKEAANTRQPVVEGCIGGYSLVVKKENRRKANSQQWWLGPHATSVQCKYALATDCGTFFERMTVQKLIERLDNDISTHAVTGTQRTMPAELQGDGSWEVLHNPFHFLLRMLQKFEFEVDNVSFMSIYNTLGAMHVIPGPCGLYRYDKLGSMKDPGSLMQQYFCLFSRSNRGLVLGNVELVEDRIPGTLLAFPPKKSSKDENTMPVHGWPKTGLVHDAVFYMEAEKPLSQLVKQRRRWLNGTFSTYLWMLQDGIITNANQDPITKMLSWCLVVLGVFQGLVVRMFGPALLIVWTFRFGLFIPDLIANPGRIFDPSLSLLEVEAEHGRLRDGILFGGLYMVLYICFVIGHTPRAKPVQDEISIVRFTEPSRFKNDTTSSYRGWLFIPILWINFVVLVLYILNAIGIVWTLGWDGTPVTVRVLIIFCFLPFVAGALDGVARCNFKSLWNMIISAPFALPLMLWFTIWLPAYATTRLSDLSWGNRSRESLDETEKALTRAEHGEKVARFLIGFNVTIAIFVIALMQFYGWAFPVFVMAYTLVLSCTFAVSFLDSFYRIFTSCSNETVHSVECQPESNIEGDEYKKMEDTDAADPGNWCCFRRTGGSQDTSSSTDSDTPSLPDLVDADLVDAGVKSERVIV